MYALLTRAWHMLSAALTVPLIVIFFSPGLQGYYYTFAGLLGAQTLLVLGLGQAVQQFVSHEWARLEFAPDGTLRGDAAALSRLASLREFVVRWYGVLALITVLVLGTGGFLFMRHFTPPDGPADVAWTLPWLGLCVATALNLFASPALVFVEGCNEVAAAHRIRLQRATLSRVAGWIVIACGGGLWALPVGATVSLLALLVFTGRRYGAFFVALFAAADRERIRWRREIWPVQWRLMASSLAGYACFSLLTPILFAFHGPVIAGRMGMTWSLLSSLWGFSFALLGTRVPSLAIAAARRNRQQAERVFRAALLNSTLLLAGTCLLALAAVVAVGPLAPSAADRILAPAPTALLVLTVICNHLRQAMVIYVRTHKREPFWGISLLEAGLAAALLPCLGYTGGATGISLGLLTVSLVTAGLAVPVFLKERRRVWHAAGTGADTPAARP